jgi:acyl-homoserine lactone acylase PvdQ
MILFHSNRDNVIRESLNDAIIYLRNRLGSTIPDNMATWQYGALHVVQFAHPLGSVLGYLNNPPNPPFGPGPVPADGDAFTVAPGSHFHTLIASETYLLVSSGPSYRGIYEAKDGWDTSLIVVPPGESGLVTGDITAPIFSPHYRDTFGLWLYYLYTPCLFNDAIIQTSYESKTIFYRLTGDVNLDKKVDIKDFVIAAIGFGSHTGDRRYNPFADVNRDGVINIIDLVAIAKNFGKTA